MKTTAEEALTQYPIISSARAYGLLFKKVSVPDEGYLCDNEGDSAMRISCFLLAIGHNLRTYQDLKTFAFEPCIWWPGPPQSAFSASDQLLVLASELLYQLTCASVQRATHDALLAACERVERSVIALCNSASHLTSMSAENLTAEAGTLKTIVSSYSYYGVVL